MSGSQYRLSATLAGHAADVRALATAPNSTSSNSSSPYSTTHPVLFSTSRDGSARSWVSASSQQGGQGGQGSTSNSGGEGWTEGLTFGGGSGHEGFVNAVEWLPGSGDDEAGMFESNISFLISFRSLIYCLITFYSPFIGFLLTAGQDKLIHAWPLPAPSAQIPSTSTSLSPSHTLIGHDANVCALHVSENGKTIVSGSWDK